MNWSNENHSWAEILFCLKKYGEQGGKIKNQIQNGNFNLIHNFGSKKKI